MSDFPALCCPSYQSYRSDSSGYQYGGPCPPNSGDGFRSSADPLGKSDMNATSGNGQGKQKTKELMRASTVDMGQILKPVVS